MIKISDYDGTKIHIISDSIIFGYNYPTRNPEFYISLEKLKELLWENCGLCGRTLDVLYSYILRDLGDLLPNNFPHLCCYCKRVVDFPINISYSIRRSDIVINNLLSIGKHVIPKASINKFIKNHPEYREKLSIFVDYKNENK